MIFDKNLHAGRRFLVTGASSGIGRATAIELARHGARLVVIGRSQERLAQTLTALEGSGHEAHTMNLDGSDEIASALGHIAATGGALHGIFHAAGIELIRPVKLSKAKQFDDVFTCVKSGLALARGAAMRDVMCDGGAIIFMSSVAGQRGQTGMSVYSAAKAAIDGMVRSLAVEFAPRRIRINAIAAAAVRTEMHERLLRAAPDQAVQQYETQHLLGFGEASDIAQVVSFLGSDAGRWITGAIWTVDGGYLAR